VKHHPAQVNIRLVYLLTVVGAVAVGVVAVAALQSSARLGDLWLFTGMLAVFVGGIAWWMLEWAILSPLRKLVSALDRAGEGDRKLWLADRRRDEIGSVARSFNRMQRQVAAGESHIQAIVEHAPNAIISCDAVSAIQSFNPAAEHMFGYARDEVIGRNIGLLMPESLRGAHDGYLRRFVDTGKPKVMGMTGRELTAVAKDGAFFPVEVMVNAMRGVEDLSFVCIVQDLRPRKAAEAQLKHLALYDRPTELPNRILLARQLTKEIEEGNKHPFALLLIGLNRLKLTNEILGYATGDQVLLEVGRRLAKKVGKAGFLARLGGDVFALMSSQSSDADSAQGLAHELLSCFNLSLTLDGFALDVDASMGIALFPQHGVDTEALLRHAMVALDSAKRRQLGVVLYTDATETFQRKHLTLAGELRHAIDEGELRLHYQPKVDINTRRVAGVEALVRWQHPEHGLIPPDSFIPMAEQSGVIHPLTHWVLNTALAQAREWRGAGIDLPMAINIAVANLADAHLLDQIRQAFTRWHAPTESVILEITETGLMVDPQWAQECLNQIHDMGIGLAIDDFGTGYSTLAYLKDLPVCELKIDRSFICNMSRDEKTCKLVRATIRLAHDLDLTVVAEGVEDDVCWRQLAAYGCDQVQGYYLARPMPAEQFLQWLHDPDRGGDAV